MEPLDEFFRAYQDSRPLFEVIRAAIGAIGPAGMRVGKSQIAFRRRRSFAWVWIPGRYLGPGHPPIVLSVALAARNSSSRWKQIVRNAGGHYMHHIELSSAASVDDEVRNWLRQAYDLAA